MDVAIFECTGDESLRVFVLKTSQELKSCGPEGRSIETIAQQQHAVSGRLPPVAYTIVRSEENGALPDAFAFCHRLLLHHMAELKCLEFLDRALSITSHNVNGGASLCAACELKATTDACSGSLSLLASIVSQVLQPEQSLGFSKFLRNHFEHSGVHDGLPYCQVFLRWQVWQVLR